MASNNDEYELLDPDLVEDLKNTDTEDPFVTEYGTPGNADSEKSINFTDKWFPDEDSWQGKTNIHPIQAKNLALLRNLPKAFEEIEHLEDFIEGLLTDYEQYLTSINGEARQQQMQILKSMFGGPSETDEAAKSAVLSAFAQREMGDNNE